MHAPIAASAHSAPEPAHTPRQTSGGPGACRHALRVGYRCARARCCDEAAAPCARSLRPAPAGVKRLDWLARALSSRTVQARDTSPLSLTTLSHDTLSRRSLSRRVLRRRGWSTSRRPPSARLPLRRSSPWAAGRRAGRPPWTPRRCWSSLGREGGPAAVGAARSPRLPRLSFSPRRTTLAASER